jgi:hypothetical protein
LEKDCLAVSTNFCKNLGRILTFSTESDRICLELYYKAGHNAYLINILFYTEVIKMDSIKKYFPLAFKVKNDTKELLINVLIHVGADILAGLVIGLLAKIPLIGGLFGLVGGLVGLYFTVSVILSILDYLKVLK